MHFVYSGNFIAQAQLSQFDSVRMVMGISPEEFCWNLKPGEDFQAPEVVMTYSGTGLGRMTRSYHDFYRRHLLRSPYTHTKRPILINNWEATYFNFNTEKLLGIARMAKELGIEMLVMDDGWFGKRDNDDCSLGDWQANEDKLPGGVKYLAEEVEKIGLKFGIWFEPEMISPDSDLYRQHPDWAIHIPGRPNTMSRAQYVLDLSNPLVEEHTYQSVASILRSAPISYVKWDMNRQLSNLGSAYLDTASQQELFHRYVLAVYRLQERLLTEFPRLLLENCSGGGARFDPGMLYYSPQIWCSDDTDAVERLAIQEGTALIYPLSCMGAHVSDCPNHAVGRTTPFATRGHVALAGTFGYELDITKISQADRDMIPEQCRLYHQYNDLIREGDYYRLASYAENHLYDCYMVVSKDKSEALLTYVQVLACVNRRSRRIRLDGLDPLRNYRIEETDRTYPGDLLMQGGLLVEHMQGDAVSLLYHLVS
jgi:alpha-galactosidase